MADMETWQNPGQGTVVIMKIDRHGGERHETIGPGQKLTITREDREMNQDIAATPNQDLFSNGMLIPFGNARILNGDESEAEMATSPNMMADSDLEALFKLQWRVFPKKVGEISSPITLSRLMDLALKVDATVKQVEVINARIAEVDPTLNQGENVILGRAKSVDGIVPRGLDGDDPDYRSGRN